MARILMERESLEIPVHAGEVAVPADMRENDFSLVSISDADGSELYFTRTEEQGAPVIRCYSYPGIFVHVDGSAEEQRRLVLGAELNGARSQVANFSIPPTRSSVSRLPGDGIDPTYVAAIGSDSPFYLLRAEGMAWTRLEAADIEPGDFTTIPATPCGSVAFRMTDKEYPGALRLIVNAKGGGRTIMTPVFRSELEVPMDGWPVGEYVAFLTEAGSSSPRDAVSEMAKFTVDQGQTTVVQLVALAGSDAGTGYLRGTLQFEAWDLVEAWYLRHGFRLIMESLSAPDSVEFKSIRRRNRLISTNGMSVLTDVQSGNPAWSWDAGEYPVGDYRMHVEPVRAWVDFTIRTGEVTVLDQPIPPLAVALLDFGRDVGNVEKLSPFLSFPKEWETSPPLSRSPPLIEQSRESFLMIAPPGQYTFAVLWGIDVHEREIELVEGWNSLFFNLGSAPTSVIALIDEQGVPRGIPRSDWDRISVELPSGAKLRLIPTHVRRNYVGTWSEAVIDISAGNKVVLKGFLELGLDVEPAELELEDGVRHEVVVK